MPAWKSLQMRVGTDVTHVEDVAISLDRFGDRYLYRLFTSHEIESSGGSAHVFATRLAARFAAKEAAIKVLRPMTLRPPWRSIEVYRHESGWCELRLSGEAARQAQVQGITDLAVSMTHNRNIAAAVVVACCGGT